MRSIAFPGGLDGRTCVGVMPATFDGAQQTTRQEVPLWKVTVLASELVFGEETPALATIQVASVSAPAVPEGAPIQAAGLAIVAGKRGGEAELRFNAESVRAQDGGAASASSRSAKSGGEQS